MPLCSMESSEKRAPVYGREAWKAPRRFRLAEPGSSLKPALPIYLHAEVIANNADIAAAHIVPDGNFYDVDIEFKTSGATRMRAATASHIGRPVAFLIDGQVIMAPVVVAPVGSYAEITGNFTKREAERVVKGIIGK